MKTKLAPTPTIVPGAVVLCHMDARHARARVLCERAPGLLVIERDGDVDGHDRPIRIVCPARFLEVVEMPAAQTRERARPRWRARTVKRVSGTRVQAARGVLSRHA